VAGGKVIPDFSQHKIVQSQNSGYPAKPAKFEKNLAARPLASLVADFSNEKSGIKPAE